MTTPHVSHWRTSDDEVKRMSVDGESRIISVTEGRYTRSPSMAELASDKLALYALRYCIEDWGIAWEQGRGLEEYPQVRFVCRDGIVTWDVLTAWIDAAENRWDPEDARWRP